MIIMIKGIAHVAYLVSDLEKSLDFYVNKLGFQKKFTLNNEDGKLWIVYLQISENQFIELFPENAFDNKVHNGSYQHLCLEVDNLDDLVNELQDKGVEIDEPIITGIDHNLQAWIHDPDGNPIELMEYGQDSLQKK
jgi:lactoylglutathione lyase